MTDKSNSGNRIYQENSLKNLNYFITVYLNCFINYINKIKKKVMKYMITWNKKDMFLRLLYIYIYYDNVKYLEFIVSYYRVYIQT